MIVVCLYNNISNNNYIISIHMTKLSLTPIYSTFLWECYSWFTHFISETWSGHTRATCITYSSLVVMLCSLISVYEHFREMCCLHTLGWCLIRLATQHHNLKTST